MKSSAKNIALKSYEELFMTHEQREDEKKEKVEEVEIANIVDFPNHPFKILKDEELMKVVESIESNGIINPCIGREAGGKIQLISGHRRKAACEILGIKTMPVIVREMTDEQAIINMVDTNIQRETVLPSEKAFAYKMKLDAMNRQGKRTDLTSVQLGQKLSRASLAKDSGESQSQIQRYIRLTNLIPELLERVDNKQMAMSPAVEISFLTENKQIALLDAMESCDCTPSQEQAIRLKRLSAEERLTPDVIETMLSEEKPNQKEKLNLKLEDLRSFFLSRTHQSKLKKQF